jgi:hypothetical protein
LVNLTTLEKSVLMRFVPFGKTGFRVSQFALRTGLLGHLDDGGAQAQAILASYVDAGGNLTTGSAVSRSEFAGFLLV